MRLAFLRPKYWPPWMGLAVMRSIELLPFGAQRHLGAALGNLIRHLPLAYVRIARRNLDLCLPRLSAQERDRLVDEHCLSLGLGLCETATTWWSSDARVRQLAEVQGVEHLQAALKLGRGAILIGGHFTPSRSPPESSARWCL
jgi:KDO2-lipid IV(A) lauroyltransferase